MIAQLHGTLLEARSDHLLVRGGDVTYAVLVPSGDVGVWMDRIGEQVDLTTLHYLEASGQGTSMIPRLIGFRREQDRAFFELFTTVKGIGARKALRMLSLPFGEIADAIAQKDFALLTSLREVGKRTAETIVAELHGKVDPFIDATSSASHSVEPKSRLTPIAQDAITVLVQLGEPVAEAELRVREAMVADPSLSTADAVVSRVYAG